MDTAAPSETPHRMTPVHGGSTDAALLDLLDYLEKAGYRFITPTPATHARVIARPDRQRARSLEDVLGWNLPFAPGTIDDDAVSLLLRSEEHTSELQSLMRNSYAVFCLKKKNIKNPNYANLNIQIQSPLIEPSHYEQKLIKSSMFPPVAHQQYKHEQTHQQTDTSSSSITI